MLEEDIYVLGSQKRSLLGRRACETLGRIRRLSVDTVESAEIDKRDHPKLFDCLGKISGQYEIKLRNDCQRFDITTPRRVSFPLLEIVRSELQQLEDIGVIRKVEQPTDWCAGMVLVAKTKGVPGEGDNMLNQKVRMYMDLTKLNESVQREKHNLPSVDQTLGRHGLK